MKKILLISVILISIFSACNKKITETNLINKTKNETSQVKNDISEKINFNKKELNKTKNDSVNKPSFREHKSIHQIEWEEHQKDTVKNKIKIETTKAETVNSHK